MLPLEHYGYTYMQPCLALHDSYSYTYMPNALPTKTSLQPQISTDFFYLSVCFFCEQKLKLEIQSHPDNSTLIHFPFVVVVLNSLK